MYNPWYKVEITATGDVITLKALTQHLKNTVVDDYYIRLNEDKLIITYDNHMYNPIDINLKAIAQMFPSVVFEEFGKDIDNGDEWNLMYVGSTITDITCPITIPSFCFICKSPTDNGGRTLVCGNGCIVGFCSIECMKKDNHECRDTD